MEIDLREIKMFKGQQYEAIITTIDKNGKSNAAPFGIRVLEKDEIFLRIFDGGNTIENIKAKGEFIVNISDDPLMFTLSTTDTIPDEYLRRVSKIINPNNDNESELAYLTNADAYFICTVKNIKSSYRENDPIKDTGINFIKATVKEIEIKNKCVRPINRAMPALIEALVNYSRIDIVDKKTQKDFIEQFLESERIIKRVGNKEEKESINILKEDLIRKGFDLKKEE